jgi:hypothetical protein
MLFAVEGVWQSSTPAFSMSSNGFLTVSKPYTNFLKRKKPFRPSVMIIGFVPKPSIDGINPRQKKRLPEGKNM